MSQHTFGAELRDFWRFLLAPRVGPRLPGRSGEPAWIADWRLNGSWLRLFAWVACLWAVNLLVLGPMALGAASAGGATHRIDINNLPVLTAALWAPLVEELLFRYGLRRPLQALWLVPVMIAVVLSGPQLWTGLTVMAALLLCLHLSRTGRRFGAAGWRWRRRYIRAFGVVFHLSVVAFAVVHLINYKNLAGMSPLLGLLLVLPQWVTGLVVGWMRVRRGVGAAIAMHAMFNGGPVLLIWGLLQVLGPEALA